MGAIDDQGCPGHEWELKRIHLSVRRGLEREERCVRCGGTRYVPDWSWKNRGKLKPTERLRGE